jgi:hypothetical protein
MDLNSVVGVLSLSISSRVPLPSAPQRIEESRAGPRQIFSHGLKRQKVPYVCVCGSRSCKLRSRAILNVNVRLEVEVQHCLLEYRPAIN